MTDAHSHRTRSLQTFGETIALNILYHVRSTFIIYRPIVTAETCPA